MALGPAIRRLFGAHEHRIAALYRGLFVDIDDFGRKIAGWVPDAASILEVGCGEGAVTENLAALYPDADITAIDITPRVGRLYRGRMDRVRFLQTTVQAMAGARPQGFDLVILSDVLHHVPPAQRAGLIAAVRGAMTPGGALVFKDWERRQTPIHWLCHASDRWLTGDRVHYLRKAEAEGLFRSIFAAGPAGCTRIAPWTHNFAFLLRA